MIQNRCMYSISYILVRRCAVRLSDGQGEQIGTIGYMLLAPGTALYLKSANYVTCADDNNYVLCDVYARR